MFYSLLSYKPCMILFPSNKKKEHVGLRHAPSFEGYTSSMSVYKVYLCLTIVGGLDCGSALYNLTNLKLHARNV